MEDDPPFSVINQFLQTSMSRRLLSAPDKKRIELTNDIIANQIMLILHQKKFNREIKNRRNTLESIPAMSLLRQIQLNQQQIYSTATLP